MRLSQLIFQIATRGLELGKVTLYLHDFPLQEAPIDLFEEAVFHDTEADEDEPLLFQPVAVGGEAVKASDLAIPGDAYMDEEDPEDPNLRLATGSLLKLARFDGNKCILTIKEES